MSQNNLSAKRPRDETSVPINTAQSTQNEYDARVAAAERIIEEYLTQCRTKTLTLPPTRDTLVRIGEGDVMQEIFKLFVDVSAATTRQDTVAAVLMAPSGVGKTFTAHTYPALNSVDDSEKDKPWYVQYTREDDSRWEHLGLYLGFNTGCHMTRPEEDYIKKADYSEEGFGVVVLGRLVGLLAAYIAAGCPKRSPEDGDVHQYIEKHQCDTLLHDFSIPAETMYDSLMEVAAELLLSVPKVTGATTTVLIIVDEAQELDEIVWGQTRHPMNTKVGGAQHALKCLRNLQLKVMDTYRNEHKEHMCLPMAIATGIQPKVTMPTATQGANVCISGNLTTLEHFCQIASNYAQKHNKHNLSPDQVTYLATLMYPRVRPLLQRLDDPFRKVNRYPMVMCKDECLDILIQYLNNQSMNLEDLPPWCCYFGTSEVVPYLDVTAWGKLLRTIRMGDSPFFTYLRNKEWRYHLEYGARNVLHFILRFYYSRTENDTLNEALLHYRQHNLLVLEMIGFSTNSNVKLVSPQKTLDNDATKYHPFEGHISHAHSCTQPLSSEFRQNLKLLMADGNAVISHCGSSAPIDFLVTVLRSDRLQMTYIDAKSHSTQTTMSQMLDDARRIAEKALWVHGALMRQLPQLSADFYTAIITNVTLSPEDLSRIEEASRCAVPIDSAEEIGNVYLAPKVASLNNEWPLQPEALYLCQDTSAVKYFKLDATARVHCYCVQIKGALEEASAIADKLGVQRGDIFLLGDPADELPEEVTMYSGNVLVVRGVRVLCPSNFVVQPWTSILFQEAQTVCRTL